MEAVPREVVTTEDVASIADTLEIVSSKEEELSPVAVQTVLDIVQDVSTFPEEVLSDAQNFSDASNRLVCWRCFVKKLISCFLEVV